jgi:precorrin-6B methylase 2
MKSLIKSTIGKVLIIIFTKKAKELSSKGMTIVVSLTFTERLMRDALLHKAKKEKDFDTLSKFHQYFWKNKGEEYFSTRKYNKVLEEFFVPQCSFLLDLLQEQLQKEAGKYNMLVEIGTGEGTVLEHLSLKMPQIERFVGIDLSTSQIDTNKKLFNKSPKLEFIASDAFDWIKDNRQDYMIIFTCNGVLEYFTQSRLQDFFNELNSMGKIIFIAIEPVGVSHNFLKNPNSEIYGSENSFSHNYEKMFQDAGFTIWHQSKIIYPQSDLYNNLIGAKN